MFVLGVVVSLCFIPGWTGAIIPTQYAVLSAVLPFTLWRQGQITIFHWLGIAMIAYATASLAWNADFYGGVYGLWLACIMALSFWFGSTLHSLRDIYAGLAVGAAISSMIAIVQALGYQPLPVDTAPGKFSGIYFNTVVQGSVLTLLFIALLSERMFYWAFPLLPGIALSGSRGAWLALAIGVVALYVRKIWLLIFVIIIGAIILWLPHSPSDAQRLWFWQAAFNELTFFGNGVGSFASQMYSDGKTPVYPEFVHNDPLQLAYEYGVMALVPATIFGFVLFRTKEREWPVFLVFITMSLYYFPLYSPITAFAGLLIAGRLVRSWNMDGVFRSYSGQVIITRLRATSCADISLVTANKGCG